MVNLVENSTIITKIYDELELALKSAMPDYFVEVGDLSIEARNLNDIESTRLALYISNKEVQFNKNNYPCINTISIKFDIDVDKFNGKNFHFNKIDNNENEVIDFEKSNSIIIKENNCIAIPIVDGNIDCPFVTACQEYIPNIDPYKSIKLHGQHDMDKYIHDFKFKFILLELVFDE